MAFSFWCWLALCIRRTIGLVFSRLYERHMESTTEVLIYVIGFVFALTAFGYTDWWRQSQILSHHLHKSIELEWCSNWAVILGENIKILVPINFKLKIFNEILIFELKVNILFIKFIKIIIFKIFTFKSLRMLEIKSVYFK